AEHPMPKPSALDDALDPRRVRALVVEELEKAKAAGHTLLPQAEIVTRIRGRELSVTCPVTGDVLDAHHLSAGTVAAGGPLAGVMLPDGSPALQLTELAEVGRLIRDQ